MKLLLSNKALQPRIRHALKVRQETGQVVIKYEGEKIDGRGRVLLHYEVFSPHHDRWDHVKIFQQNKKQQYGECTCDAGRNHLLCWHVGAAVLKQIGRW